VLPDLFALALIVANAEELNFWSPLIKPMRFADARNEPFFLIAF
jgi:hypothetical protein